MVLSRRRFLGAAAAMPWSLSGNAAQGAAAFIPSTLTRSGRATCLLVDLGDRCALPESLSGFARGLAGIFVPFERVFAEEIRPAELILIPGALLGTPGPAKRLRRLCDTGATVLYETGAAYTEPGFFEAEQRLLRDYLALDVLAPANLWEEPKAEGLPYVHYQWPARVLLRDFSQAIPVSAAASRQGIAAVAHIGRTPVCCRSRMGCGEFIFLGSPLGPHLAVGDREAQALLQALLVRYT